MTVDRTDPAAHVSSPRPAPARRDPHPRGPGLRRQLDDAFAPRRRDLLQDAAGSATGSGSPWTSCAHRRDPGGPELAGGAAGARPDRPAGGDHRAAGAPDDRQRPELRRPGLDGGLRGRHRTDLGQHRRRPAQPAGRRRAAARLHHARGQGVPARRPSPPPSWSGRAAGTCPRSTWSRRPPGPGRASSTSGCTSSTAPSGRSTPGTARTSTCRSWRTPTRPGCGTTSSSSPRTCSASRAARSAPPCSSRRSPPRSRWRRSSTNSASTARD